MTLHTFPRLMLAGGCAMWAVALAAAFAQAETKVERLKLSKELVREALHREVYGLDADREKLLEKAVEKTPDLAEAQWHLGRVNVDGKWVDYQEYSDKAQENVRLNEYRRLREESPDTIAGHLELANWCGKHKLADQERAHLTRVIELSPDHSEARRRMGHVQIDGQWLSREERVAEHERSIEMRKSLGKWRPKMKEILGGLTDRGQAHREAVALKLRAVTDPSAISAMEEVLSPANEEIAKLVIETISTMPAHEASVALARQAVYSPFAGARELACEKLSSRSQESYVPQLLSSMSSPVVTRSQIFRGRSGQLVTRHVMMREGQDHRDLSVLETEYERIARLGGDRDNTLARALDDARRNALAREAVVNVNNSQTMALNLRVMNTLEKSTGEKLPPTPQDWWSWWNEENEVYVQDFKPVRQVVRRETVQVVDAAPQPTGLTDSGSRQSSGPQRSTPQSRFSGDCLAAGTKVWTELGLVAIENVQVGDRVLSQDPDTGELAYKPVLGTTIRPASRLVRMEIGNEAVTTSGGHLFWVSGDGWTKARKLTSGSELHGVAGTVRVSSVKEAEFAPTYNLIVADFSTYFVGKTMVFCHDNTIRQPTNAAVPGLTDY